MKPWVLFAGLMALGGCGGLQVTDPASPYYAYTTGWTLELNRPLTIPAGAATVRLQYGAIVARNSVQEHDPFCVVELDTVGEGPQVLRPGRFDVWRVTRSTSTITAASGSPFRPAFHFDHDAPSFLYFITEFRLRDSAQPQLRGMRCAWNQMAPGNRALTRHLTTGEIGTALGGWARLVPPGATL